MKNLDTSSTKLFADTFTLKDFYSDNRILAQRVDTVFSGLNDDEKIAQMIITSAGTLGKQTNRVIELIKTKKIGGVLLLGGSKETLTNLVKDFKRTADSTKSLPMIFSTDGEPGLINLKISGIRKFKPANSIKTIEESGEISGDISIILKEIGINQNYAPVCDLSLNKEIISSRSFSNNKDELIKLAVEFIKQTQARNIAATVKHFPGHGNVIGDSHKELVFVDGELKELDIFKEMVNQGVISVMVGHIAVKNNEKYNTDGLPSTLSRKIVTDLLKNELGFKGIIITDGMNMGALNAFTSPSLNAVKAGCDLILMPSDEGKLLDSIKKEMEKDSKFREQVYESVKKIIRLKLCLGLMNK